MEKTVDREVLINEELKFVKDWYEKVNDNFPYKDKYFTYNNKYDMYNYLLCRIATSRTRIKNYLDKYGSINVYNLVAQDRAVVYLLDEALEVLIELIPEIEVDLEEKEINLIRKNARNRVLKNVESLVFQGYPNVNITKKKVKNGEKKSNIEVTDNGDIIIDLNEVSESKKKSSKKTEVTTPKRKRRTKAEMESLRAAGLVPPKRTRKTKRT
jgi:hypothetical protein